MNFKSALDKKKQALKNQKDLKQILRQYLHEKHKTFKLKMCKQKQFSSSKATNTLQKRMKEQKSILSRIAYLAEFLK